MDGNDKNGDVERIRHDLRGSMNLLSLNVALLQRTQEKDEAADILNDILSAVAEVEGLMDRFDLESALSAA